MVDGEKGEALSFSFFGVFRVPEIRTETDCSEKSSVRGQAVPASSPEANLKGVSIVMPTASLNPATKETPNTNTPNDSKMDSVIDAPPDSEDTTELKRARQRLDRALGRLEAVLDAGVAERAETEAAHAAEKSEKSAEISRLKAENRQLQETRDQVSDRLDSAIGRLAGVLES